VFWILQVHEYLYESISQLSKISISTTVAYLSVFLCMILNSVIYDDYDGDVNVTAV